MPFTAKDVKDVAYLVSCKLETYINNERRELHFDPSGRSIAARHPMWQYDTFPKLFNHVTCDTARSRGRRERYSCNRKPSGSRSDIPIDPVILVDSLKAVPPTEASYIVAYANQIFKSHQIDRLQEVLAYKPSLTQEDPKPGHETPQNYTCHVGSCLKSDHYANYYKTYGVRRGGGKGGLKPISKSEQKIESQQDTHGQSDKGNIRQNEQGQCYAKLDKVDAKSNIKNIKTSSKENKSNSRYESCRTSLIGILLEDSKKKGQHTCTSFEETNGNLRPDDENTTEVSTSKKLTYGHPERLTDNATMEDKEANTEEKRNKYDLEYFLEVFKS